MLIEVYRQRADTFSVASGVSRFWAKGLAKSFKDLNFHMPKPEHVNLHVRVKPATTKSHGALKSEEKEAEEEEENEKWGTSPPSPPFECPGGGCLE